MKRRPVHNRAHHTQTRSELHLDHLGNLQRHLQLMGDGLADFMSDFPPDEEIRPRLEGLIGDAYELRVRLVAFGEQVQEAVRGGTLLANWASFKERAASLDAAHEDFTRRYREAIGLLREAGPC